MSKDDNKAPARLLLVDDDPDMLDLLVTWFESEGMHVVTAKDGEEALSRLDVERPNLVLTDLVMDGMDGLHLVKEIHRHDAVLPVIMLSGQADIADAMNAAHLGVHSFLTKPVKREGLLQEVRRVLDQAGLGHDGAARGFGATIIHRSAIMTSLLERARMVAGVDSTVLITGSTGTGKELLARAIHDASPRSGQAFISVNCSAIPDQILESELFGHEKGAFTGATNRHEGLFKAADGGTLFLDEVGDMPLELQAKLLRVLQDFQVRPVGSTKDFTVDVRILSATHQDLPAAVEAGDFREDLYYRLSVVPMHMPDLDERREDISPIIDHLLTLLTKRLNIDRKRFSPEARELLHTAAWPGNIRQLANVIEQCVVLSSTEIIPAELVKSAMREQPSEIPTLEEAKRTFERRYIIDVLRMTGGHVSNAARLAGRNRTEFYKLLTRHALDAAQFRDATDEPVKKS